MKRTDKGFTLIELLIVVAIIGIIAAIAIPNLLNAIDRGKQKRTMADMRSIGTAIESYAVDNNVYPVATTSTVLGPASSRRSTSSRCRRRTAGPTPSRWRPRRASTRSTRRARTARARLCTAGTTTTVQRRDLLHQRPVPAVPGRHPAVAPLRSSERRRRGLRSSPFLLLRARFRNGDTVTEREGRLGDPERQGSVLDADSLGPSIPSEGRFHEEKRRAPWPFEPRERRVASPLLP